VQINIGTIRTVQGVRCAGSDAQSQPAAMYQKFTAARDLRHRQRVSGHICRGSEPGNAGLKGTATDDGCLQRLNPDKKPSFGTAGEHGCLFAPRNDA
jgi:hypothetical protein